MRATRQMLGLFIVSAVSMAAQQTLAQTSSPPSGYIDIPPGFDFPADKRLLEHYRAQPNLPAQRLHAWNVFAGMTQPTPDGKNAIFETWFSEDETFDPGTSALRAARTAGRRFQVPAQFRAPRGAPAARVAADVEAAGRTAVLSFVLYNFPAYDHVRRNKLHQSSVLDALAKNGAWDAKIPQNRTVPPFPPASVVLKTVWWPVAKDKISAMPIWDAELNPPLAGGNPPGSWARYIGIDAVRPTIPAGETADIVYDGQVKRGSHIVGLRNFHFVVLDADAVAGVNSDGLLANVAQRSFGRALEVGDFAVLSRHT